MAQMIGSMSEFNPDTERITPYLERLTLYLKVNKITGDSVVPAILSIIGGKTYSLLRDLLAPTLPVSCSKKKLFDTLKQHYNPKPLIIAERFKFHQRCQ